MTTVGSIPYTTAACTHKRNMWLPWTRSYDGSTKPRSYPGLLVTTTYYLQRLSHIQCTQGGTLPNRILYKLESNRRSNTMRLQLLLPLQLRQWPVKKTLMSLPQYLLNYEDLPASEKLRISCSPSSKGRPMLFYPPPVHPENKGCPSNGPMLKNKGCPYPI